MLQLELTSNLLGLDSLHFLDTFSKLSFFLPVMANEAPHFENKQAIASPIPELAPIRQKEKP